MVIVPIHINNIATGRLRYFVGLEGIRMTRLHFALMALPWHNRFVATVAAFSSTVASELPGHLAHELGPILG
jgi:hypothetical protein